MERLRNRDLRTNNSKCYTMYFDDDQNKDITNNSGKASSTMPLKKIKAKSPRKREPVKSVAKPASAALSDDSNPATAVVDMVAVAATADNDSDVLDFTVAKSVAKLVDDDDDQTGCPRDSQKRPDKKPETIDKKAGEKIEDAHQEGAETTAQKCGETVTPAPTPAHNERKRRLSMCRDDDDDERDDGDEGVDVGVNDANCGTVASSSSSVNGDGGGGSGNGGGSGSKKSKMEFSREQMFQVRESLNASG